ncbi:hypothetical protein HJFPF1_09484 [Paramyrothecium foliicola]|nr:hypothetical protein HJFPF1_09484 [Paramyrothecium foliicola]
MANSYPFRRFPPEVRHHIYLLATPPRVVTVEAVLECWEDFEKRYHSEAFTPADLRVHPDIAYYARLWDWRDPGFTRYRSHVRRFKQTTLDSYNFTSNKPRKDHWELEDKFPLDIILSDDKMAYNVFHTGELYSTTRIPHLLHTYSESRAVLVAYGYELAFGTRTHKPMTWFHFGRDILRLGDGDYPLAGLLNGLCGRFGNYLNEVGQFHPHDLQRVQQLALTMPDYRRDISSLLQLMPHVQDLYMIVWEGLEEALVGSAVPSLALAQVPRLNLAPEQDLECLVAVEEIDVLWTQEEIYIFGLLDDQGPEEHAYALKNHKRHNGFSSLYTQCRESQWTVAFQDRMKKAFVDLKDEHAAEMLRSAPKCHYVHLCTLAEAGQMHYHRQAYRKIFAKKREAWLESQLLQHYSGQQDNVFRAEVESRGELGSRDDFCRPYASHDEEVEWWVRHGSPTTRYGNLQIRP